MAKKAKKAKSRPKQSDLPGMENREIKTLQDAAHEYAEVRDERMELTTQEVDLKDKLLGLMKQHEMKKYKYQDVVIEVVVEEETVKVRIVKPKEAKQAAD